MTSDRWQRIADIFQAAQGLEGDERAAFVRQAADSSDLRREVESLLAADAEPMVLDHPIGATDAVLVDNAAVQPGTFIGHYRIDTLLGAGGMGEVYRARDTQLNRDVAIKILPPAFASDPDRLARFKREAQVLASINHPNIGGIYGFEDSNAIHALILELIDGPTLADRVAGGPLPLNEALAIAKQICDALEAAQEQGIIHRDLKPANIKVREDGTVKVLDFGLAKFAEAISSEPGVPTVSQSPTITTPAMTAAGMILGTAAYMSPEQAKGKPADKRSDIWAFGCVLYEMLTGERPFKGDDVVDTLASILKSAPDWERLPTETPASIRRLLYRALTKDNRRRPGDITGLRLDIDDATELPPPGRSTRSSRTAAVWAGIAIVSMVTAVASIVWNRYAAPPAALPETHVEITTPATTAPASFAISPDGRRLAFVATLNNRSQLFVRDLGTADARPLSRTEGASYPFWSPDSRSLGFFAGGFLKKVDLGGDLVNIVVAAGLGRGGTWGRNGTIVYAENALSALTAVSADGGLVRQVTQLQGSQSTHSFPTFLPDGRHFLFFIGGDDESNGVYVGSIDGDNATPRRIAASDGAGSVGGGYLWFVRQGALLRQPFSPDMLELSGTPERLIDHISVVGGSAPVAPVSVSRDGTLAYRAGTMSALQQLVWVDRHGKVIDEVAPADASFPTNPSLSRDGRLLAVTRIVNGNGDIWQFDLERRDAAVKLVATPQPETYPLWSPDAHQMAFTRARRLFLRDLSSGNEQQLLGPEVFTRSRNGSGILVDWSDDGGTLLVRTRDTATGYDLQTLSLDTRKVVPFAVSPANEREGQFSPDSRWIAYSSDENGRFEIYARRYPEGTDTRLISQAGGAQPRWRRDGRELFYIALDRRLMSVPVTLSAGTLVAGTPVPLFETTIGDPEQTVFRAQYEVAKDGTKFLMNTLLNESNNTPIELIFNLAGTRVARTSVP